MSQPPRKDSQVRKLSFLGFTRGENADENEAQLDEEMEKVFSEPGLSKFDVRKLSDINKPASSTKLDEATPPANVKDYDTHRKYPPPYPKNPKSMSKPSSKELPKKVSTDPTSSPISDSDGGGYGNDTLSRQSNFSSYADYTSRDVSEDIDDDEPPLSERVTTYRGGDDDENAKKVQFNKGGRKPEAQEETEEDRQRRRERQYHYKSRKYSLQEYNPDNRGKQAGSESGQSGGRRVSVQPEDASLQEADLDTLTSHRSEDPRGMRRFKVQQSTVPKREGDQYIQNIIGANKKSNIDRSPHEVFVQLDELSGLGEDREWKETARWIKYEEDVMEGSDRWGKPHVASLSFHSLLNLRRCLETGVVLMDLEEKDLPGVAYRVVEQMVIEDLIHPDDKASIMRALLLRHRHVNDHTHGSFHFGPKRKYSSYSSLQNVSEERKRSFFGASEATNNGSHLFRNGSTADTKIDMSQETTYTASQEDLKKLAKETILKRIPDNAEATTVLVGSVEFLEQPTIAFVRLSEGIMMPSITEVPIPVRFLFILLGPKTADLDYHEVGRSIATLMSNRHFHNIAYKADDRRELLSAINEFLDDSIVLPPGKWDKEHLLPFEELKAKNEMIRTRKKKAIEEKLKTKPLTSEEEKKLLAAADEDDKDKKQPDDPLRKTGRLFGGMINDIKRRMPMYKSDIKDGLNSETLAATLFLYFAGLATAITFGALVGSKTNNLVGISETLISACFVGMIFHAFSSQPLVFVGTTGPLILFDDALMQFCTQMGYNFLMIRVYIGFWLSVIALTMAAFEGSAYVRLFTRFTQEIFSALITLIYLVETALKLVSTYKRHPLFAEYVYENITRVVSTTQMIPLLNDALNEIDANATEAPSTLGQTMSLVASNETELASSGPNLLLPWDDAGPLNQPNTALFCTLLTLGTFTLAYSLKIFRNSKFLGRNARRALGDFGVPISIAIFLAIDLTVPQVFTDKLAVPDGISPSEPEQRGWLIPFGPVEPWLPFVCLVPALLVYILIFMETQISELIVGKPERGLKKGNGLHWDIVLLCFCNSVCGMFGLPWHCAATVRSVTHVSAVTIMSTNHAPGDSPKIADIKEQRLSGFFVSLLIGLSLFASPLLKQIPMAVLFGVFLYMGICSMIGVQFFERLRLIFMPVKHHPQVPYVRRLPTWKMHVFTIVQVLALALLWGVKSSKFSLAFPFILMMMVPIRQQLERIFTPLELRAVDGNQPNDGAEDEPDFYEQAPLAA
ncbi:band 3 anion transport protein-like isoform X2 [Chironomus tepperi]|uniref:band 3 anion transport protein-like isoform X2 n=1 Tax=Chironomus tepperi TaxID=113505 RepID=UPI00391F1CDC